MYVCMYVCINSLTHTHTRRLKQCSADMKTYMHACIHTYIHMHAIYAGWKIALAYAHRCIHI